MLNWFRKKPEAAKPAPALSSPSSLEIVESFLAKYDQSQGARSRYAMTMWGINEAFLKIFSSLDGYRSADASNRARYDQIIADDALKAQRANELIVSECNRAFLNFISAKKGVARGDLRGQIESIADRMDGIIRFGKSEVDRIGEMESKAKEFLASEAAFAIGSGTVKGAVTERSVIVASQIIINDLQRILNSHQDYYLYIIEQYVRLRREPSMRTLLDSVPLFDIECELLDESVSKGEVQSPGVAYIESIRPSIRDWCRLTVPALDPDELSLRVIGAAYGHFRNTGEAHFDEIRRGYAQRHRDRCDQLGQNADAGHWTAVLEMLEG